MTERTAGQEHGSWRDSSSGPRPGLVFALGFVTWRAISAGHGQWASHRLLARVLADPGLGRVLVADPSRSAAVLAKRALAREASPPVPAGGRVAHVEPLRLRRHDPRSVPAARRAVGRWERRVARAAASHGLTRPPVLTNSVYVAGLADLSWAGAVTYYATDDWLAHPRLEPWHGVVQAAYRGVRERRRRVCAVSASILERIMPEGPSAVVPNGVAAQEWTAPGAPPEWFARLPRPRAVYVGTLDQRLDVAAVRAAAGELGDGSLLLVGGGAQPSHLEALGDLRNVHVHGDVGRDELAAIVCAADLGLLPHTRNALTVAMSPLKLFEYLAGGLAVAAIDLPPVRGIHPRVRLADGPASYGEAVREALAAGRMPEAERREFLREHSWERRHEQILRLALG